MDEIPAFHDIINDALNPNWEGMRINDAYLLGLSDGKIIGRREANEEWMSAPHDAGTISALTVRILQLEMELDNRALIKRQMIELERR